MSDTLKPNKISKINWTSWTVAEALARTSTSVLQKSIGLISQTLGQAAAATGLIGLTQASLGLTVSLIKRTSVFVSRQEILGASLFGGIGFLVTILGFNVFIKGGDLGTTILITSLSIIPGGLIDSLVFKRQLSFQQWLAVALGLLAAYSVLGAPALMELKEIPSWLWLAFGMMLGITLNQWLTQTIKDINPFVKNFWGGTVQLLLSFLFLLFLPLTVTNGDEPVSAKLVWSSLIIGLINVAMWVFNVLSYRDGATIAGKKLLMNAVFLSSAMIAGILFFQESLSPYKVLGVLLYFSALALWHKKAPRSGAWSD